MDGGQPERLRERAQDDVRTRLAERERELARTRRELAHAQRVDAVGRVALGAMHEFNNALTCVLSFNQLAELDATQADCHAEITNATRRAARLARQMLALGRSADARPENLDLTAALHEIHDSIARSLGQNIETRTEFEAAGTVRIDPIELGQILLNLATNARDALNGAGRVTFRSRDVEFGTSEALALGLTPGHYATIEVVDSGCGIPTDLLPRVFESFVTTKTRESGTGLGLGLSRKLAGENGGTITLVSELGSGTVATLILPVIGVEARAKPVDTVAAPRIAGRILLVEPDASVRSAVMAILEAGDCEVIAVSRPITDLLTVDLVLRADESRLLIARSIDGPSVGWVDKPFTSTELAIAIDAALKS